MEDGSVYHKYNQEKRKNSRDHMLGDGKVTVNGRIIDCIFLDISPTGARIGFGTPTGLTNQVSVELPDGKRVLAERRWQRGNVYGLKFISAEAG